MKAQNFEELAPHIKTFSIQGLAATKQEPLTTEYVNDLIFDCTDLTNNIYYLYKLSKNERLPVLKYYIDNIKVLAQKYVHNQMADEQYIQGYVEQLKANFSALLSISA